MNVHVVDHPLIAHKLTMMRDKTCNSKNFRELLGEIASLMTYDVTKNWETEPFEIETPLEKMTGTRLKGEVTIIPILRAGLGLLNGVLAMIQQMDAKCIVVDPMLATGGSAAAAITMLKEKGLHNICLMVLVAAPEGIKVINEAHPDVEIYTAAVDRELNERAYILPGLGDAGDRVFGTL